MNDLLSGELVHLKADDPQVRAKNFCRWNQDTEWIRLLDTDPPRIYSEKKWTEWFEKELDKSNPEELFFSISLLGSEEMIGFIGLFNLYLHHGDALVAIALGDPQYWGKGYGTDAMRVLLRYGFNELNLRKVGLIVFEYNPRAIRSYEKAGFVHEGRVRGTILREGRRWDFIYMSVMREEWLAKGIMTS